MRPDQAQVRVPDVTGGADEEPGRGEGAGGASRPLRYPVPQRRRRGEGPPPVYDILTPTRREAHLRDIEARQRRYLRVMIPCIVLVLFGFFCWPAPTEWRLAAIAVGSFLPPVAAMVGNT